MCNDAHKELYIDQRCSAVLPGNSPKKSAKTGLSPSWPIEKYGDIIISTILKTPKSAFLNGGRLKNPYLVAFFWMPGWNARSEGSPGFNIPMVNDPRYVLAGSFKWWFNRDINGDLMVINHLVMEY